MIFLNVLYRVNIVCCSFFALHRFTQTTVKHQAVHMIHSVASSLFGSVRVSVCLKTVTIIWVLCFCLSNDDSNVMNSFSSLFQVFMQLYIKIYSNAYETLYKYISKHI